MGNANGHYLPSPEILIAYPRMVRAEQEKTENYCSEQRVYLTVKRISMVYNELPGEY